MTIESFHHRVPSPSDPIRKWETRKVIVTDMIEVTDQARQRRLEIHFSTFR